MGARGCCCLLACLLLGITRPGKSIAAINRCSLLFCYAMPAVRDKIRANLFHGPVVSKAFSLYVCVCVCAFVLSAKSPHLISWITRPINSNSIQPQKRIQCRALDLALHNSAPVEELSQNQIQLNHPCHPKSRKKQEETSNDTAMMEHFTRTRGSRYLIFMPD